MPAQATTTFNTVHFVQPGSFAIGVEPTFHLQDSAGVGINARYTHGIGDMTNLTGLIGTGAGPQQFRVGANLNLDLFPDLASQPGIGLNTQGTFYMAPDGGHVQLTTGPYIHKTFEVNGYQIEPYIAVPLGIGFSGGVYKFVIIPTLGSLFKLSQHFRAVAEIGVGINTVSTISGGVVYYP
jgi:hypothetical protein